MSRLAAPAGSAGRLLLLLLAAAPAASDPSGFLHHRLTGERGGVPPCGSGTGGGLGAIAGEVSDADSGQPVPAVQVDVVALDGTPICIATTASDGSWTAGGLAPGEYRAATFATPDWVDELWDDHPCPNGLCDGGVGDAIVVTADATSPPVDFALERAGGLAGTATEDPGGAPIGLLLVEVVDPSGGLIGFALTGGDGSWSVGGLPAGTCHASTAASGRAYLDEAWDDRPCLGALCDPTAADPLTVTAGSVLAPVDFVLQPLLFGDGFESGDLAWWTSGRWLPAREPGG